MAATDLSDAAPGAVRDPPASEMLRSWRRVYAGVWAATIAAAGLVTIAGRPAQSATRELLALRLNAHAHPPGSLGHVLALAAHNIPIAGWPLLLGVGVARHRRLVRALLDVLVLACLLGNTLPVGGALATYGAPLLAYLPQLPMELAALALGYGSWLVQRERPLRGAERAACLAVIAGVLACAAVLESFAVPHR